MASSNSLNDYIVQVEGHDIRTVIRPLVEYVQYKLQRTYPDQDFTFTGDEFLRDVPAEYELAIDWYRWEYSDRNLIQNFVLKRFELIRPVGLTRDVLDTGDTNLQFLPGTVQTPLRDYFLAFQKKLNEDYLNFSAEFHLNTTYRLRLRW